MAESFGSKDMALLMGAFVTLLIGVFLLTTVSSEEQSKVKLTQATSEVIDFSSDVVLVNHINMSHTYTLKYPRTGWKADDSDCALSVTIKNVTGATWTSGDDYVINTTGQIFFKNSTIVRNNTAVENKSYATYQYCADDYIAEGWNRSVLNLVPGMFAIALLLISVALFYQVLKNNGIANI